ncbi:MAG: biopolymer transporter ExbD [Rhodobacteraceae bacterium]|nr:biopolymer transporter ExbD [Paracoccaceae bacterium]
MTRRLALQPPRPRAEPTIALINIVFLMLIFFLIAGSIRPRADADIALITLDGIETALPEDALIMQANGSLRHAGEALTPEAALARFQGMARLRLLPDRAAPASELVSLAQGLRAAGVSELVIVTAQGLP